MGVEEGNLTARTIITFFSDNGANMYTPTGDGNPYSSNSPLRGGKGQIYDGGIRLPCIFVWPGKIAESTVSSGFFAAEDFYPTILAMIGQEPAAGVQLDGLNQVSMLRGGSARRKVLFTYMPVYYPVVSSDPPAAAVHVGDLKLIRFFYDATLGNGSNCIVTDRFELYNLTDEVGEVINLAHSKPDVVIQLNEMLEMHMRDTNALVPLYNPLADTALCLK